MNFSFQSATMGDSATIAQLHNVTADYLTYRHGHGPWSSKCTERGILYAMRNSHVFVVREGPEMIATVRLATKKPWAIDVRYFTPCNRPLYLVAMAVLPTRQRQGVGRWCLEQIQQRAGDLSADVIRLDAFDAVAGAGPFYARCGYTEVGRASYRNTPLIYYELLLDEKHGIT